MGKIFWIEKRQAKWHVFREMDENVRELRRKWKALAWVGPGLVFAGVAGVLWIHLWVAIPVLSLWAVWGLPTGDGIELVDGNSEL